MQHVAQVTKRNLSLTGSLVMLVARGMAQRGLTLRTGIVLLVMVALIPGAAQAAPFAYVMNQGDGTISVLDLATNSVVATVPVGTFPTGIAVSPDGTRVYVANFGSDTVSVISTETNAVVASVGVELPAGVAVSPDGKKVFVAAYSGLWVIDAATNAVIASRIPAGLTPQALALSPDGRRVYVADVGTDDAVSVIDASTYQLIATVPVGAGPGWVAVTPDGSRAYVLNGHTNTVSVIDTATNSVVATIGTGEFPTQAAVSPDGQHVYVACGSGGVEVIATATNTNVEIVPPSGWHGLGLSPNGMRAYAGNLLTSTVAVIDTEANTVITTVPVGSIPVLVAVQYSGYTVSAMRAAGVSASALKEAGLSAASLLAGGFTVAELLAAGFSLPVTIDIKPGSFPNSISLQDKGVLPVAILSTSDFYATSVDPTTVQLGDPRLQGTATPIRFAIQDVDGDGRLDLLLFFSVPDLVANGAIDRKSTEMLLTGSTFDNAPIAGMDSVRVVPPR